MKISTLRSLLFLLNVCLLAGIGWILFQGFQEKKQRDADLASYRRNFTQRLASVSESSIEGAIARTQYNALGGISLAGEPPKPKAPEIKRPTPTRPKAPPLDSMITLMGMEVHTGGTDPSLVFYSLSGSKSGAPKPALRTGIPASLQRGSGKKDPVMVATQGGVIELGHGYNAVVKLVKPGGVTFHYEGQDIVLELPDADPKAGSQGSGSKLAPTGPISNDTGTYIKWDPAKPSQGVAVTAMGARAFKKKGESLLDGIRFDTETLPDGKAIKLVSIPKDNVIKKAGGQDGDVITHINGTRVSSKGDIVRYIKANPNLPEYTVAFMRNGNKHTRVIRPPRL